MKNKELHPLSGKKQSQEHIAKRVATRKLHNNFKHTPQQNLKSSIIMKGRKPWNTGKFLSKDHREKLRQSHIGKIPWNKGKKGVQKSWNKGKTKQTDSRIKSNKGRVITPEWRKKMSESWSYEKHVTEKSKEKQRLARLNQVFPFKDTKPERMMQLALYLHKIKFEKHKAIIGQPDIFIEPNICVFVDGDYWHKLPRALLRDAEVNHKLNLLGYQVIRIWESDIEKDANICAENIIKLIKETSYPMERTLYYAEL